MPGKEAVSIGVSELLAQGEAPTEGVFVYTFAHLVGIRL
jgi:hypothetical protein